MKYLVEGRRRKLKREKNHINVLVDATRTMCHAIQMWSSVDTCARDCHVGGPGIAAKKIDELCEHIAYMYIRSARRARCGCAAGERVRHICTQTLAESIAIIIVVVIVEREPSGWPSLESWLSRR